MSLSDREKQVILEEAERAKMAGYCTLSLKWVAGKLVGVQMVQETNKDELKARLDPDYITHEVLARGAKVLTKPQSGS